MTNLLTIKNLKIEALDDEQWKPIVNDIDLTLARGDVLGLIGESGAGKSTIGLAAMGYTRTGCRIVSGSIVFNGTELTSAPEEERRKLRGTRIAYVAQSAAASFNPAHRLIKQFAEAPVQHGLMSFSEAENKAVGLYRRLELPEPETIGFRFPHQVSGGQLQRAMVAMAMAGKPDIIIFDEPTTALDVTTQIEVLAAIKEVTKQRNTAAIYISHDLAVVAQLADRIMVLRYGDLIEEGAARELLAHPKKEYTQQLLSVRSYRKEQYQPGHDGTALLEIHDVSASYTKGIKVVEDVNLRIHRSKTVAVVGESGSGKTTLARVITGLLPPLQGKIIFDGQELPPAIRSRHRESLRRLQMIYQMPDVALNPRQKVRKILGRPLTFYFGITGKQREDRMLELLDMVELSKKYAERYPSELSGGEKQRICIARALAANPELIICDEVTSALDQLVAEEVLRLLQRLQDELDVSYLFITHDLATVKAIADEIVVMLEGRIVEQGEKQEILTPPHHDYTELLLSSVPEMDPDWLDNLLEKRQAIHSPQV
jgi:peptide/nickel transport system ATP-binding protein